MSRRALLRVALAAVAAPVLGTFTVRKARPASAGTGSVAVWRWVTLDSAMQVFVCARAGLTSTPITWTADGTVSAPALGLSTTPGNTTMSTASRCGLTVRRI